jgi:hypothetical protein
MKDLNEVMQAILEMDATTRKAVQGAEDARRDAMASLSSQKTEIAQNYAQQARRTVEQAEAAQQKRCDDALAALAAAQKAAGEKMAATAAQKGDEWAETLAKRAIEG